MTATMPDWRPSEVRGADGWRVRVDVAPADPPRSGPGPAALLVPASAHERDAFGVQLVGLLTGRGFTVAATDIRGRGASRTPRSFDAFPPGQLANVRDDVGAALDLVAGEPAVDPARLVVFAEQDTADAAVAAAVADERVCALVLISARLAPDTLDAIGRRRPAVCGLVAKEDRLAMRSVTAAYRVSAAERSRLRVVAGVGPGTTMFAAWQYLHPDRPTLEQWLAAWCDEAAAPDDAGRR